MTSSSRRAFDHGGSYASRLSGDGPLCLFRVYLVWKEVGETRGENRMNKASAKVLVSALVAALVVTLMPSQALAIGSILDVHEPLVDLDVRDEKVKPTAEQKAAVRAMGAHALWNRFGTPVSLINYNGFLAEGLSSDP